MIDGVDSEVWSVLAEPSRRAICLHLAERPRAVGELAKDLPISRPAVSQHLRVLKAAGLVIDEIVGTRRVYRLDHLAVAALRDQLEAFWDRALAGYQDAVTQSSSSSTAHEEDP
jgi:DNA-binding transcriptional ArsR family regulator